MKKDLTIEEKVIEAYADGSELSVIIDSFNITYRNAIDILRSHKESSRHKNTFTDEFKKMIAERDQREGITRKSIAEELDINQNTVKKACEQFGQSFKEKADSDNVYTTIIGKFTMKECPTCKSKTVNKVEEKSIFCKKCGNEHIINDGYALKINWEHLEE